MLSHSDAIIIQITLKSIFSNLFLQLNISKSIYFVNIFVINDVPIFFKCFGNSQIFSYLMEYLPKYMKSILKIHTDK